MARILLIDDNEALRQTIKLVLASAGHQCDTAADGNAGMRLFSAEEFDLVITDLIMPEKEGIETIQEMRKLRPYIRIIAMSGGGSLDATPFLKVAGLLGAETTLTKPFSGPELLEAVNRLLPD